jgi:hypothetical protein
MNEISNKMINLVSENDFSEQNAWNESSVQLVNVAKLYISIFMLESNLDAIIANNSGSNRQALVELFELYILYEIVEIYAASFLRVNFFIGHKKFASFKCVFLKNNLL